MKKRKIAGAISACALGVLSVPPCAEAMVQFQQDLSDLACPRGVVAIDGRCEDTVVLQEIVERDTPYTLRSTVVPARVEVLGEYCFFECSFLSHVVFEANSQLTRIEEDALAQSGLQSFHIPAGVQMLGRKCLARCLSLASVTFEPGSQMMWMGASAFSGSSLQCMCIPAGVQELGAYCFFECPSLTVVTFEEGSQLRFVGDEAFAGSAMESIRFLRKVDARELVFLRSCIMEIFLNNQPVDVLSGLYGGTDILRSVTIPRDTLKIRGSCFKCCKSLDSVLFEANSQLVRIGAGAFAWSRLRCVSLPASVQVLEDECFAFCSLLTSVTFEAGSQLKVVEDGAFVAAPMKRIDFPHVVSAAISVFAGSRIKKIFFANRLASLFSGFYAGTSVPQVVVVPQDVITIGPYCFRGCKSLDIVFFEENSQLETIEEGAFYGSGVQSITLPPNVTVLREECFAWCQSLTLVTFQAGFQLRVIERSVFERSIRARVLLPNGGMFPATQLNRGWMRDLPP
ncbi:MAG: leucine-rich repeat domain-containing protein [Holosporales bacterium]|nr:leucine-rich repeat domain-containing protein [Holosporales bacterium]